VYNVYVVHGIENNPVVSRVAGQQPGVRLSKENYSTKYTRRKRPGDFYLRNRR